MTRTITRNRFRFTAGAVGIGALVLAADKSCTPTGVTLMAALVYNKTKVTDPPANGLIIHPTNGPTLQALTSGQIKLALVQSSAAIGAVLGDNPPNRRAAGERV